ncbi:type II secretion system F family protein [Pseudomonas viridiflava]
MMDLVNRLTGGLTHGFAAWQMRHMGEKRIMFYESLQNLVENGISPNDALKELNKIWSEGNPDSREALAIVSADLMVQLTDGAAISQALSRWVPYEEASLIAAGERSAAGFSQAFDDVIKVIEAKQEISSAVKSAVMYPSFLMLPMSVLLWAVSEKLVPKIAQVADPEKFTGSSYLLYQLSQYVTNWGLITIAVLLIMIVLFAYSLPRWTGPVRAVFDKGPFYSTYRIVHGSTFLLNLAVMMRANIPPDEALKVLGEYANPWMKERILGARHGLIVGSNLGIALESAGHSFPDKRAIDFVKVLAAREGFPQAISKYSARWLQNSIKNLQNVSRIAFAVAMLMMGSVLGLVVLGVQEMQSNFEQTSNRTIQK